MDLSITKYGKANLTRPSAIITDVYNGHTYKFIVILKGNDFSFYTRVRIDDLHLPVAVVYPKAPQIIIIFLYDLN